MEKEEQLKEPEVKAYLEDNRVITENSDLARELYNLSRYGTVLDNKRVQLSFVESVFLAEKGKLEVYIGKKRISSEQLMKKALKFEPNFWARYQVFKDFRTRGYIIKTALKFGADFRVYERGVKPGDDHAKWIVYPVREADAMTWYEFSSKNRVAHSTKKKLLIGCVDEEGDCTYWEVKWTKP